jgi:hypothetical protein
MNRMILAMALFCGLLLLFPILVALKTDGRIDWSCKFLHYSILFELICHFLKGTAVFFPTYCIFALVLISVIPAIFKDEHPEGQEAGPQGKSLSVTIMRILTVLYFALLAVFDILIPLKLDNKIQMSWYSVFIPWWICEAYHGISIIYKTSMRISQGVYSIPSTPPSGEDEPVMVSRPFSLHEKLVIIFEEFQFYVLRIIQAVLLLEKIANPDTSLTWT